MKTIKYITVLVLTLALTTSIQANDSISHSNAKRISVFTIGTGFTIAGTVSNATFGNWDITKKNDHGSNATDVIQYAPLIFPWAMKALGVPTQSGWGRMATSQGLSTILMGGTVSLMKNKISSMRPDGSDMHSFPSGHAAWAYMGATMVTYELGWKSPWFSLGAYSIASTIAMQRIVDRRHLPKDVITGAGIGILSTQVGYLLGDLIWKDKQKENYFEDIKTSNKNTHSLSIINSYAITLNKIKFDDFTINISPGFEAGMRWHSPIHNNISLSSSITVKSSPLYIERDDIKTYIAPLNSLRINIAQSYHININKIYSIDIDAGCIYNYNLPLKSPNKSITTKRNTLGGMANIITSMRLTDNFSIGANIGYDISQNELHVSPCKTYNIDNNYKKSNIISTLNIGIFSTISL